MRRVVLVALQIAIAPLLVACALESRLSRREYVFAGCGELLSLVPGWPGSMVRKAFYRATARACADRAFIGFGTLLAHRDVSIGSNVYIGPYCIIGCATIGDGAKIASRVSIMSGRHQHVGADGQGASDVPALTRVTIGAGAWIGEGAIVMANVGRDGVVGAGSVVVHDVVDEATVVGNPAREVSIAGRPDAKGRARLVTRRAASDPVR